jgi:hypothetical protein
LYLHVFVIVVVVVVVGDSVTEGRAGGLTGSLNYV